MLITVVRKILKIFDMRDCCHTLSEWMSERLRGFVYSAQSSRTPNALDALCTVPNWSRKKRIVVSRGGTYPSVQWLATPMGIVYSAVHSALRIFLNLCTDCRLRLKCREGFCGIYCARLRFRHYASDAWLQTVVLYWAYIHVAFSDNQW